MRTKILYDYKKHQRSKDDRTMDEICAYEDGFKLQVQQEFLKAYVERNPEWKSLLLYHQIGSGKTCTSIVIAEEYMRMNPKCKVTVILPARLKTNYIDELISPCGMEKYLSARNFQKFFDPNTSQSVKNKIKADFMAAINEKYDFLSFDNLKQSAKKIGDLRVWARTITKDRMIIVDEVHNLLSETYDSETFKRIMEMNTYESTKPPQKGQKASGIYTILFKYLIANMHQSGKLLLLTATPIFNHISQFKELVHILSPESKIPRKFKVADIVPLLKGKVSFFPGTSQNAYPSVKEKVHEIPLSETQDVNTRNVLEKEAELDEDAFLIKQRQIAVATLPNAEKIDKNIPKVISNINEHCPKIAKLLDVIENNLGKHAIYTTFVKSGTHIIKALLESRGWTEFDGTSKNKYKTFAIWDGEVKDNNKTLIKKAINDIKNMDGKKIRVLIGSPSIKEGISLKHVQHMHILDPVWNISAKNQIEGRAIRFCSHVDIPVDHPTLKRSVKLHIYKSMPRKNGIIKNTCDQEIYDKVIPSKEKEVRNGEKFLKKIAIDHFLFRNLYLKERMPSPARRAESNNFSLGSMEEFKHAQKEKKNVKNTCPKNRRPDKNNTCKDGYIVKTNTHGDLCCYKEKKN